MSIDILTATALVIAALCGACLVVTMLALATATFRGNTHGMRRAGACIVILATLTSVATALLGAETASFIAKL